MATTQEILQAPETHTAFPHTTSKRASVQEIAPGLACLPLSIVNVYFSGEPGAHDHEWVLIDAALPLSASTILEASTLRFGGSRPHAIVLTHGHFDHVGALPRLAAHWDVPVFAHELELPYLSGESSYPPPDPIVGGGLMALFAPLYPRGPIDLGSRLHALPADGSVPGMPGWRWVHTPGHTPGHVSFFRESDRVLIAGDAFVTTKQESLFGAVLQWDTRVRRPPAYYTSDWDAARRSVQILSELHPEIAVTGHGHPMHGERLRRELECLWKHWDRDALPAFGRYIGRPAVSDRNGVVHTPPPVVDPRVATMLGIGGAALGWWLLRSLRSRSN